MTIEWVAPASAASLVSSMVVAAEPPNLSARVPYSFGAQPAYLQYRLGEAGPGSHYCPKPFVRSR